MADVQKILALFDLKPVAPLKQVNEGDDVLSAAKNSLNKVIQAVTQLDQAAALNVCTEEWNKLYAISTTRSMCEAERNSFLNIAEQVYNMMMNMKLTKPPMVSMPDAATRLQSATLRLLAMAN
jgi:hypothetical protein